MSEKNVEQKVITNPFDYGYVPGTLVSISGELFGALMQFVGASAQEEVKETYVIRKFPLETGPEMDETGRPKEQPQEVMLTITPKGKRAEVIFNECMDVHVENINSGMAVENTIQESAPGPQLNLG